MNRQKYGPLDDHQVLDFLFNFDLKKMNGRLGKWAWMQTDYEGHMTFELTPTMPYSTFLMLNNFGVTVINEGQNYWQIYTDLPSSVNDVVQKEVHAAVVRTLAEILEKNNG